MDRRAERIVHHARIRSAADNIVAGDGNSQATNFKGHLHAGRYYAFRLSRMGADAPGGSGDANSMTTEHSDDGIHHRNNSFSANASADVVRTHLLDIHPSRFAFHASGRLPLFQSRTERPQQ